jgi:hypothetical protein
MREFVKPIVFTAAALLVVAGLWFLFRPQDQVPAAPEGARAAGAPAPMDAVTGAAAPASPTPARDVFELVVRGGRLVSGPAVLQVHEGEQVTLRIRSDRSDEVHLHGYDLHAQIGPQQTASLQFTADRTGRFDLELHKANTELGALEVYPR